MTVRLGAPDAYAAELRAAAGLPVRGAASRSAAPALTGYLDRIRVSAAFQGAQPVLRQIRRLLVELRPAWWVLCGYLLVLVSSVARVDAFRDFPVPAPVGSHLLGLVLVVAAVVGSVSLGRRTLPRALGVLVVVGGLVLAWLALAM